MTKGFKAAVVQAASLPEDSMASVTKAAGLTDEAEGDGARLIVFPEGPQAGKGRLAMAEEAGANHNAALRRKAYVDAGREAFLDAGFGATTMSSIAARVGGSKTTLWSYFPSKEELLAAVVDDIVDVHAIALSTPLPIDQPIAEVLERFAISLLASILSPKVIGLHRFVAGEAQRFPHVAKLFYERGPAKGRARSAAYLGEKMAQGELRNGDPQVAAMQLFGLCQAGSFHGVFFGMQDNPDSGQMARDAAQAVDAFLRAWRPES